MIKLNKFTIDEVSEIFEKEGCVLVSSVYVNRSSKLEYICSCKNTASITLGSFLRGSRCSDCGKRKSIDARRKYTIEIVKEIFADNDCVLLEKTYINTQTPLKFICNCGNTSKIRLSDFLYGCRCQKCKSAKLREKYAYSLEEVKDIFLINGNVLLENEYINSSIKLKYICDCGKTDEKSLSKYQNGQRCAECGVRKSHLLRKKNYIEVYEYFSDQGCQLLDSEQDYISVNSPMNYLCNCGRQSKITFSNFKSGQRCYMCKIEKTSGENHHNWNPNLTDEDRERRRQYPEYHDWVKSVYSRDNYDCQNCGKHGGVLHAHHILNYADHRDIRTNLDNGITLCEQCHATFHKTYGYRNNNLEQLISYIPHLNLTYNVHH